MAHRRVAAPSPAFASSSFQPVALAATIDHPLGPLHVFTTALEWEPAFATDHLSQSQRVAELVSDPEFDGPLPVLLAADLNAAPGAAEVRPLLDAMDDLWVVGGGDPRTPTLRSANPFAPSRATKQLDKRIDYVLARPHREHQLRVDRAFALSSPVDGVHPSDHDAVVIDLTISDRR